MKRTLIARTIALAAMLGLAAGAVRAEDQPASSREAPQVNNAEDCRRVGLDLAQIAEDKKLPDAKLDTLEDLMGRMTDFCAEQKFVEANALAKDMKTLIEQM